MSINPYQPPTSEVADLPATPPKEARRPPLAPLSAGFLVAAGFVLAIPRFAMTPNWSSPIWPVFASFLVLLVSWFVISSVYKARNWVRWIAIFLGALGVMGLLSTSLPEGTPLVIRAIDLAQGLMQCIATVLLLLPSSKKWFTRASDA